MSVKIICTFETFAQFNEKWQISLLRLFYGMENPGSEVTHFVYECSDLKNPNVRQNLIIAMNKDPTDFENNISQNIKLFLGIPRRQSLFDFVKKNEFEIVWNLPNRWEKISSETSPPQWERIRDEPC